MQVIAVHALQWSTEAYLTGLLEDAGGRGVESYWIVVKVLKLGIGDNNSECCLNMSYLLLNCK